MAKLNLANEIIDADGVLRLTDAGEMQLLLAIDLMIMGSPGYRLRTDVTAARILAGLHPGDIVRVRDALVQYHGDNAITVISRRWDGRKCEFIEIGRRDKSLTAAGAVQLITYAALEAHANSIHKPDGAHHAFTGVAYNPSVGI